jgi:hypothetical protein
VIDELEALALPGDVGTRRQLDVLRQSAAAARQPAAE